MEWLFVYLRADSGQQADLRRRENRISLQKKDANKEALIDRLEQVIANRKLKARSESKVRASKIEKHVYDAVSSWTVYHVHDTSETARMRRQCPCRSITSDCSLMPETWRRS